MVEWSIWIDPLNIPSYVGEERQRGKSIIWWTWVDWIFDYELEKENIKKFENSNSLKLTLLGT